jgi:hypothetical protein
VWKKCNVCVCVCVCVRVRARDVVFLMGRSIKPDSLYWGVMSCLTGLCVDFINDGNQKLELHGTREPSKQVFVACLENCSSILFWKVIFLNQARFHWTCVFLCLLDRFEPFFEFKIKFGKKNLQTYVIHFICSQHLENKFPAKYVVFYQLLVIQVNNSEYFLNIRFIC